MKAEEIKEKYIEAIRLYYSGTNEGNSRRTNKGAQKLDEYFLIIKDTKMSSIFEELINHKNIAVQYKAATDLLVFDEKKALKKLKELEKDESIIGFEAKYTIKEWNNGNLKNYLEFRRN